MKSLTDIEKDMSSLYDKLSSGEVELKLAAELANIAGKNLKAKQLRLAEDIFLSNRDRPSIPASAPLIVDAARAEPH